MGYAIRQQIFGDSMHSALLVALASFIAWIVFGFVMPVGIGAVHLLLAVAATFLVRWWALTR